MDKQNYIINNIKNQDVKVEFKKIIKYIEKKLNALHLIKRKRKIKKYKNLIIAAYYHIVESLSYQRLSDFMSCNYNISMSDTAWKKRIKSITPYFLEFTMEYLNEHSLLPASKILEKSNVYAIDTTEIPVEGGKGDSMRVHTNLSLTCAGKLDIKITDRHTAESALNFKLEADSLYIADKAYGKSKNIAYAYNCKSDFLFRISPNHIALYLDKACKTKINFKEFLSDIEAFSLQCYCKYDKKVYTLLIIGNKLPVDKQEKAIKKAKRKSSKQQCNVKAETILYAQWLILATSLTEPTISEVLKCYRKRWIIEIHFKKLKSLLRFRKIRHSSQEYMKTEVSIWLAVAFMILAVRVSLIDTLSFDYSEFNIFSLISLSFS